MTGAPDENFADPPILETRSAVRSSESETRCTPDQRISMGPDVVLLAYRPTLGYAVAANARNSDQRVHPV
ncbi:hypothetical protein N7454_009250 [Penicillium verhagenii]|nr:hypothetical protein N7454_009250 [Penicillium verhagenii]